MLHWSRATIKRKLEEIRDTSERLMRAARNGMAADIAERTVGDAGDDVDHQSRATVSAAELDVAQRRARAAVIALDRLAAGIFGVCIDCRKPIPSMRIQANPLAGRCISCQTEAESQESPDSRTIHHALFPEV